MDLDKDALINGGVRAHHVPNESTKKHFTRQKYPHIFLLISARRCSSISKDTIIFFQENVSVIRSHELNLNPSHTHFDRYSRDL